MCIVLRLPSSPVAHSWKWRDCTAVPKKTRKQSSFVHSKLLLSVCTDVCPQDAERAPLVGRVGCRPPIFSRAQDLTLLACFVPRVILFFFCEPHWSAATTPPQRKIACIYCTVYKDYQMSVHPRLGVHTPLRNFPASKPWWPTPPAHPHHVTQEHL